MKQKPILHYLRTFLLLVLTSVCMPFLSEAQKTAITSGDWSSSTTWGGAPPTAADPVVISSGVTVTVTGNESALSVQVGSGSAGTGTLSLATGSSLTVTGTISLGTSSGAIGILTVGTGANSTLTTGGFAAQAGSTFTPGSGTVVLSDNNSIPATGFSTFNNLTLLGGSSGASLITHVLADLTINGTLTTNAFSILDLRTLRLLSLGSVTNNGTIQTQNTSATPIPASMDWSGSGSGTVLYNDSTGSAQTIVGGTYGNLFVYSGTSGSVVNNVTGNIAIAGLIAALTTNTIIDFGTHQLTATLSNVGIGGQNNVGTIRTAYVGASNADPAIPLGRTWGGTIVYYAASGQKIISGTYNNLTVLANGTDIGSANIVINGAFASSATTIIDLASEQLTGTFTANNFLGTLLVQASTSPFPAGLTWGGTISYNGTSTAQTIVSANYNNLIITGYRLFDIIFPANINVAGNLTLDAIVEDKDFINSGTTVTLNGSSAQTIDITAKKNFNLGGGVFGTPTPFSFYNLTLNGSGVKTLVSVARVSNTLTLTSGELAGSSTANILMLLDGSTTSGGSTASYISARVQRYGSTAFTFPLGAVGVYAPLAVSAPGTSGLLTAQYIRQSAYTLSTTIAAPLTRVSACEYWLLNKNAGANATVTATLSWSPQSGCNGTYINDLANLRIARLISNVWTKISSSAVNSGSTTTSGTITSDAQADFDFITLATEGSLNPLPVRFLTVQASRQNGGASIRWSTATEVNVHHYEIERSEDGRSFGTIAQAAPRGNNGGGASYDVLDPTASHNTIYYRIKGVDIDGHLTYSNTVRLQPVGSDPELTVIPNPVNGSREMTLQTSGFAAGTYDAVLFDPGGRAVYRTRITQDNGSSSRRISLPPSLASGLYQLRIEGPGGRTGVPVLLQ
jgi:hypothetical protein